MNLQNSSLQTQVEFDPFRGSEIELVFPSTESQMEIWMSCKLGGDDANRAFNLSVSFRFTGAFDRISFEKALKALVQRHDSLRASFSPDGGQMLVYKDVAHNLKYEDLSNLPGQEQESIINRKLKEEANYVFNLIEGPLFRFSLLNLSDHSVYFILTAHHIICDGWSVGVLVGELSQLYSAYTQSQEPVLGRQDSFSEFAADSRRFLNSSEYKNNESFWISQFNDHIPVLELSTDYNRPEKRTYRSARLDFELDADLAQSIREIGIREGCSFVNALLAAFELFLHAYTGQDDIIVGIPAAGQLVTGQYNLVGHCVNLLPIRSYPNDQYNFSEYLNFRKSAILDAIEHQRLTFGSLLKKLKIGRQANRVPLVPVVLNIDLEVDKDAEFHGLNYTIYSNPREFENFELFLNIANLNQKVCFEWSFNLQLFRKDTIVGMMQAFENLLKAIVSDPTQKLERIIRADIKMSVSRERNKHLNANERDKSYWLNLFSGEPPLADLPFGKTKAVPVRTAQNRVDLEINSTVIKQFLQFVTGQNADEISGFTALTAILLHRYSGQKDILVGTQKLSVNSGNDPIALPVRLSLNPKMSFTSVLGKTAEQLSESAAHSKYSFSDLLNALKLECGLKRTQLCNVAFVLEKAKTAGPGAVSAHIAETDLLLCLRDIDGKSYGLNVKYNRDQFGESDIIRLGKHLEGLMNAILINPEKAVEEFDFISLQEKELLLFGYNRSQTSYPRSKTIVELFEEQVNRTPDRIALIYEDVRLSYRNLNERANALGHYLRSRYNIQADDLVGIKLDRSELMMIAVLGVLKSGAGYVPLNANYPEERLEFILKDTACKCILDEGVLLTVLSGPSLNLSANPEHVNTPEHTAYVMYTSGSSGQPKGVMVGHRNVVRLVMSDNYVHLDGSEVLLSTGAFSFDACTFEYWSMLLHGGTLVLCQQKTLLDPKLLSEEMEKHNVSMMWFTSDWLNQLIDSNISMFKGLKCIIAGGDKLSPLHIRKLLKYHPQLKVINGYGPTENTTFSTTYQINEAESDIPIGKPISNSSVYILDSLGKLLPMGVAGEIYLGGDGVAKGYLNNPELTSEKFIANPYKEGERLYRSGDIGRWREDGNLEFLGRKDTQVKIRGYRIETGEIESVLQTHPSIDKALVLSKAINGHDNSLVAYVQSSSDLVSKDVYNYLKDRLPDYMMPEYTIILPLFPLTANGKIDKNRLPEPSSANSAQSETEIRYANKEEELLARIWSELIGIKHIRRNDNFFEIGGHSLIAIRFVVRLEQELKQKFPMSSLFEYPTIEKFAELIRSEEINNNWKCLVSMKPAGNKPPLYLVHGAGLGVMIFNNIVAALDADQPAYGLQALGIDGEDEPLETIEEMAAFYISEILKQNPDGPYHIAGHSAGGLIAYEMAHQLNTMGKDVRSVIVFDFDLDLIDYMNTSGFYNRMARYITDLLPAIAYNMSVFRKDPGKAIRYFLYLWKLRFISLSSKLGLDRKGELDGFNADLRKAMAKNNAAMKFYKMKPYDGVIDLFVANEKEGYQRDPEFLGWLPYAKKGVKVHNVDGNHNTMILPPLHKRFAEVMQDILNRNQ